MVCPNGRTETEARRAVPQSGGNTAKIIFPTGEVKNCAGKENRIGFLGH